MPDLSPAANRLLAALPAREYRRLRPGLEPVALAQKQVLYQPGDRIRWAYFPGGGVVSLVALMSDGSRTEAGVIGREGVVGVPALLGGGTSPFQAIVQNAGDAVRMDAGALRTEVTRGGALRRLFDLYFDALHTQVGQLAACNRLHTVEQRYCCWLLMTQDRVGAERFSLTQEFMAQMLGTNRTGVTEVAGRLQREGLIHYLRGKLAVRDRPGLEATACECYRAIRRRYERLLG
jgi:CRP-like cAMP-binding protein